MCLRDVQTVKKAQDTTRGGREKNGGRGADTGNGT